MAVFVSHSQQGALIIAYVWTRQIIARIAHPCLWSGVAYAPMIILLWSMHGRVGLEFTLLVACLQDAAQRTEGFSGRELAKLLASVQAAVYGSRNTTLTRDLWQKVVSQKLREHSQRKTFLE